MAERMGFMIAYGTGLRPAAWIGLAYEPRAHMTANNNRKGGRGNWSLSDEHCFCAATYAPCWVCENSGQCQQCGVLELLDDGQFVDGEFVCRSCIEQNERHYNDSKHL